MNKENNSSIPPLPNVRRVVTGHDNGRSIVVSDELLGAQGVPEIGMGVASLWGAPPIPSNDGKPQPSQSAIPGPGSTSFLVVCYPPESHINNLPPELHKIATLSPGEQVPGLIKGDTSRHYSMHYSETVDYGVVISGEVTLILDDDEVTLKQGDTYVLRGGAHAWSNRGNSPCQVAVVVVGAEPCNER